MINPEIKQLQFVRGVLTYKGWVIEISPQFVLSVYEGQSYVDYSYLEFTSDKVVNGKTLYVEGINLEDLLSEIDKKEGVENV